ncbi:MAG TPA: hypothetical protein DCS93_38600 [Microscillaceae bacterium]|nr:hypothetical protein [Microscillaceae bacterium]
MSKTSPIHRLIAHFQESFVKLHIDVPPKVCEDYAVFVHSCMNNGRRKFHTTDHVLDVCEQMQPLQVLAGLFHDVIYYQVDGGFPAEAEELIRSIVDIHDDIIAIKKILPTDYPSSHYVKICLDVFAFKSGQTLGIHGGLNEFLSAWVAVNFLGDFLKAKDLITIAACIEATIPFRPEDEQGKNCLDHLEQRINDCYASYKLQLAPTEVGQMVKLAAGVANRDVANFAELDPGKFLDNTWILLPETNEMLWKPGVYFNADYRKALMKMEGFLSFLNPENIYHGYQDEPQPEVLAEMKSQAKKNVKTANQYLQLKILGIAIIEALAMATGGDGPISMFLGDVRIYDEIERAEDYLPPVELSEVLDYNDTLYRLLEYGRASATSFDMKNSPIASFVYKCLGDAQSTQAMELARQMFAEKITPEMFLRSLNRKLVSDLAQACAMLATTRKKEFMKWV